MTAGSYSGHLVKAARVFGIRWKAGSHASVRTLDHARRTILSDAELAGLLALPDTEAETIRRYTFSDADLAIITQHRGPANRLGFAVQLCYMR